MENRSKFTAAFLGALTLIGAYSAQSIPLLELHASHAILAGAANIIMIFFVFALLIERACEVAMALLTAAGTVPPETPPANSASSDRKMVSIFVCLTFSTVVSLSGLRLVEMILNVAAASDVTPEGYFTIFDTVLTALILAGGSDGFHQILRPLLDKKPSQPVITE